MAMTSDDIVKIIVTIGAVVVTPTLAYLTLKATRATAEVVTQVKHEVNSRTDALLKQIDDLKERVAELIRDRDGVQEAAKIAAAVGVQK